MKSKLSNFIIEKNSINRSIIFFFFLTTGTVNFAQWVTCPKQELSDLILKMDQKVLASKSFAYQANQYFFNDSLSKDTVQTANFSMTYNSKQALLNIEQVDVTLVQDELIQVRVDSSSKQLFVQDVNKELVNLGVTRGFEAYLKSNTTVAKKTVGSQTIYKLTFDQNAKYAHLELWVNTKDLLVNKYILYAGREIYDDAKEEETWIKPRMEVVVKNYVFAEKVNQLETKKITDYFSDTNLLVPTKKYMDFEVIDLRNKTK
jgi:hypothetical protein